ncbi:MAG: phosphoenolpyruvate--protein phosphotransferase [Lachnospiraceae bacterium]|nr:phosphoenolpyruvate--protein phosphotransferase [Lachnospiraceae bacterium]
MEIKGQVVSGRIALGPIYVFRKKTPVITSETTNDSAIELNSFFTARDEAIKELKALEEDATLRMGDEEAMVFSVHGMLLEDQDFEDAVKECINAGHNASYAVKKAGEDLAVFFASMENNEYMNERASDFRDIANRVICKIQNIEDGIKLSSEPVILVAEDLVPSDTLGLDTNKVLAFVTTKGATNSHTAILARSLGITALVDTGKDFRDDLTGQIGIVDGEKGIFIIDPTEEVLEEYRKRLKEIQNEEENLKSLIGKETKTKSGQTIKIYANIGNPSDAAKALEYDAEGIGLFRSEFLFLGRKDYPTENEQFESYKEVISLMKGREVIIRTLDIGADKQADYFGLPEEDNPAMGLRAIRLCLKRPEIFKTQLRAIYRAAAFGPTGIMFPMITSVEEIDQILELVDTVKKELENESVPIGNPELGVMIETPAAALISDLLADKVSFFSIGTNDLTQYTFAMDRQNASLEPFRVPNHPAILRLIEMTVQNAHRKNVRVGICGEMGADFDLTKFFISIGVDELSVSAPKILALRKHIRELA